MFQDKMGEMILNCFMQTVEFRERRDQHEPEENEISGEESH